MGVAADRDERVVAVGTLVAVGASEGSDVAAGEMMAVGAAVGWIAGAVDTASDPHAIPTNNRMTASKERRLMLPPTESAINQVSNKPHTWTNPHNTYGSN